MFRNYRLAQEPAIEWPALVASPYFGPELEGRDGILVKWDLRSKMTPAFVMGLLMKDTAAMRAELSRMFPNGAKEFAEMQRLGLVSDVDAVKALSG